MCQTAYDHVMAIVTTVGGDNEAERCRRLLEHVQVVPNRVDPKVANLKESDIVSVRSKVGHSSCFWRQRGC